jgi:tetratricopeptide (TPR) repeat protein
MITTQVGPEFAPTAGAKLGDHTQQMFRLLGLVPGPDVSLAAVAALTGRPPPRAGELLDELVAAHLVQRGAPGRYRLHDLLRRYAGDRALADEDPTIRRLARKRLFGWYLSRTDAAAALLYPNMLRLPTQGRLRGAARTGQPGRSALFANSAQALAWLDAERPNLTAAVLDPTEPPWPSATAELADALRGYLHQGRHTSEAALVGRAALERARTPAAAATARLTLALAYGHLGRTRMAVRECRAAVSAAQQANWPDGEAAALTNLGNLYWWAGSMRSAADRYRRALCIYQRTGWPAGLSTTQANLAMTYRALGRLDDALECATQALAACQRSGSAGGEAIALGNLGALHRERGELESSFAVLRRALSLFQSVGNRYGQALALTSLALAHRDAGAHPEAAAAARRGLLLARQVGDGRAEVDALIAVGSVALAAGDGPGAVDRYTEALDLARRIGNCYPQAEALVRLAEAHAAAGAQQLARTCAEQAMICARRGRYWSLERNASAILSTQS